MGPEFCGGRKALWGSLTLKRSYQWWFTLLIWSDLIWQIFQGTRYLPANFRFRGQTQERLCRSAAEARGWARCGLRPRGKLSDQHTEGLLTSHLWTRVRVRRVSIEHQLMMKRCDLNLRADDHLARWTRDRLSANKNPKTHPGCRPSLFCFRVKIKCLGIPLVGVEALWHAQDWHRYLVETRLLLRCSFNELMLQCPTTVVDWLSEDISRLSTDSIYTGNNRWVNRDDGTKIRRWVHICNNRRTRYRWCASGSLLTV